MRQPITAVIADDHAIVRDGLRLLLSAIGAVSVVGEARDAQSLVPLLDETKPGLLILDLGMPGFPGFQFIEEMRTRHPQTRILVLSANVEPRSVRAALAAGASGYVAKDGASDEIAAAIEAIRTGETYVAESLRFAVDNQGDARAVEPAAGIPAHVSLSRREQQILAFISHGVTSQAIADRLGISPLTVRKHRENLMRKLDLHSSAELAAYAVRLGLPAG
ncbi:response regulator [Mesorhizobium xinjiangense]|uniref:response regulator n=1 Tax=Mesorhizobium xinjiangense TaxID=2678685 RepID=UPI0012ED88A3|nr:response regulator transcription factor [Mesorhizobium xinjiangense]